MKKIVFLAPEIFKFGGIQKFSSSFVNAWVNEFPGSQIIVFALNDSPSDVSKSFPNVQMHCFRGFRTVFAIKLFCHLLREKPDLIIAGHVNFAELCRYLRFIFRVPYAVITYGIEVWTLKCGFKYQALKKADLIPTLSRYTGSRMADNGIAEAKITILHCTVDTDHFVPRKKDPVLISELGLEGKKVILTVSRLALSELRKGHPQVLKTLQLLSDDYVWIVAGSGDEVPLLKKQAQELGVLHKVRFVGSPDASKLVDFYNLCDVFVLPSKKEGFGIVFIEAMACGKPVIAGNQDGSNEPLLDGELGFLVDPDDPRKIAQAIEAVFDRSDKRTDPAFLRTRVKEVFGLTAFGHRVKEIFSTFNSPKRVLIFRIGSLGDTVVALPCFHLIARAFPSAERWVLTNMPVSSRAPALSSVLGDSGLVHGYLDYPTKFMDIVNILRLREQIRKLKPEVLVYLIVRPQMSKTIRDVFFFKLCGIRKIVGVYYSKDMTRHQWLEDKSLFEREASRLARCMGELGDARLDDPQSWDLLLTASECQVADDALAHWEGRDSFIVLSIGTKKITSDWGDQKWQALLAKLRSRFSSLGLVLVGSNEDRARSQSLVEAWGGPALDLCGKIPLRSVAAVIKKAVAYMGHDSGPMHLAESVGTPCLAIFSARSKPGIWFPYGDQHQVIYHKTECYNCGLDVCTQFDKKCINSISVDEAFEAALRVIAVKGPSL